MTAQILVTNAAKLSDSSCTTTCELRGYVVWEWVVWWGGVGVDGWSCGARRLLQHHHLRASWAGSWAGLLEGCCGRGWAVWVTRVGEAWWNGVVLLPPLLLPLPHDHRTLTGEIS